ncbi:MAG: NAD(P)H-binding protein, partial [Solirubrobacterales bacterium]
GATGTVGKALLPMLVERGDDIRALVRDPRGLGRHRVDVRITLGDLGEMGDARTRRQALRGVQTVIHLAAAIRDQPAAKVEELNGLATARLLRAAEEAGVERFIFFSAIGATEFERTRFFRAKALAEAAVERSEIDTTVFAPSIVYDRNDPWVTLTRRLSLLPVLPLVGRADAAYEPIWAQDVARCVIAELDRVEPGKRRYELAGPERLTYEEMSRVIAWSMDRRRQTVHVPANLVRLGLNGVRRVAGDAAFATWEEAELLEVPMVSERGTADAKALGVKPKRMADVLAASSPRVHDTGRPLIDVTDTAEALDVLNGG